MSRTSFKLDPENYFREEDRREKMSGRYPVGLR